MAARKKKPIKTPVRRALLSSSALEQKVKDGIGAVKTADRKHLDQPIRQSFSDSLDLDAALEADHPNENRWDYLLGHAPSQEVVGVEPHSARQDQVSTVIRKRTCARQQLATHLKQGSRVAKWLWVASGNVQFADTEKARRRLDENGIEFVGGRVLAKHLPAPRAASKGKGR